jgi:CheY-like chemotaxis protein
MAQVRTVPYKILVVEDDPSTRIMLATLLNHAGYEVIPVSTVETAMTALVSEAPDALIADVRLDGSNGLQLVASCPRPIPTIMVTGSQEATFEREARRLGAEYLLKPVDLSTLLATLKQKLTGVAQDGGYRALRKSERISVDAEVHVHGAVAARILDVSDDGVRLRIERTGGAWLPLAFHIAFSPSDIAVPVAVIWKRRAGEDSWICGSEVSPGYRDTWRGLIDNLVKSPH